MAKLYAHSRPRGSHPIYELDSFDNQLGKPLDQASAVWQERASGYTVGDLAEARVRFVEAFDIVAEWEAAECPG